MSTTEKGSQSPEAVASQQVCSGRSMGMLCHRFLGMFVCNTTGETTELVSLDSAAVSIVDVEGRSNSRLVLILAAK